MAKKARRISGVGREVGGWTGGLCWGCGGERRCVGGGGRERGGWVCRRFRGRRKVLKRERETEPDWTEWRTKEKKEREERERR